MTDEVRAAMTDAALKVARAVNYENAGTVEFIVDGSGPLRTDGFWFMEMNTRLQVEHPVTEAVTGLDLVEWQLRIALGQTLPLKQSEINLNGHAIEARLLAEDPAHEFRPSAGRLTLLELPRYTRTDAGFDRGDNVPSEYDSLVAKVIAHSIQTPEAALPTRWYATNELQSALSIVEVEGVETNAGFLTRCLSDQDFESGNVHTGLITEKLGSLADRTAERVAAAGLWALFQLRSSDNGSPWRADGWRLNRESNSVWRMEDREGAIELRLRVSRGGWVVQANEREIELDIVLNRNGDLLSAEFGDVSSPARIDAGVSAATVYIRGERFAFREAGAAREYAAAAAGDEIKAPLPGKVVSISAGVGDAVTKGDSIITLEAMKMEHALKAPRDGVILEVAVQTGAQVKEGALLVRLEEEAE
jgi:acetyl/propionyl-CoA carboxylase alpha subunit